MKKFENFIASHIEQAERTYMNDMLNLSTMLGNMPENVYVKFTERAVVRLKNEIRFLFEQCEDILPIHTVNRLFASYQVRKWVPNLIDLYEGELEIEEDELYNVGGITKAR